jgi:hypothetical protein
VRLAAKEDLVVILYFSYVQTFHSVLFMVRGL